jgi:ribosomal protein S18 acetylase RimI-like enzyme
MILSFHRYLQLRYKKSTLCKLDSSSKETIKYSTVKSLSREVFREKFVKKICKDKHNKLFLLVMNPPNNLHQLKEVTHNTNLIGFISLREVYNDRNDKRYVVPLLCIREELRGLGYGAMLVKELQTLLINRTGKTIKLYLHSLPNSVDFYKSHGFVETSTTKYIERIERIEENDVLLCKIF